MDNSGGGTHHVEQTHPVAQKELNAWGLYDMHGNVAEWTSACAYRVLGAKGLVSASARGEPGTSSVTEWAWEVVTEETKGDYNFFKVVVEMP